MALKHTWRSDTITGTFISKMMTPPQFTELITLVSLTADQLLHHFESLHAPSTLHRNTKPESFLLGTRSQEHDLHDRP